MARIGAWTLSMLAVCAGAGASDLVTVPPGGIVAWSGQGIAECGAFGRRWAPVGNRCYFPVDLLEPEAEVPVSRWRQGRLEQAKIRVGPYPYPVQELTVVDSTVHLSEADAARAERERQLVAALWTRHGPVRFTLPLASPLDPLPEGRSFGRRRVLNGEPRSPHTGVDLSGPLGTPVRAVAAGVVALAGEHFFAGNSVFVDHGGGLITMYFHLDNLQVGEGDTLDRGQVIGALGATGRATGPHLHFGARWHGLRIDPMPLLGAGDIPEIGR